MSAVALQVTGPGPMIRDLYGPAALKDKSYRRFPVGQDVGRFLRALRWEGAPQTTLDTYEHPLALLAVDHSDFESLERFCSPAGTEYLRDFLDRHWRDAAAATKRTRRAALSSFFKWGVGEGRCSENPVLRIRPPRVRRAERQAFPRDTILRLVRAQPTLRDQCALQLLARMGLRKNELRLLRVGDVDLVRNLLTVHGKGGKTAVMPIEFESLRLDLALMIAEDNRHDSEYVLYARARKTEPMDPASVHRWLKRCLERAGLPGSIKTHELRHTAADELWRTTGNIVLAQELLRHESVGTTQAYLHPTREDLRAGMRELEKVWQEQDR